ncbi:gluconokinase [Arthrobacter castelli]|uniref:gluconokinase n=1 Tax=Arthrobacter castelli TaxID=271431 RepID=UPI0004045BF8|nr:gluconokinase [Arthrobacter castelli]
MAHSKLHGRRLPPMVLMGVSGSGKSTIGSLLSESLQVPYVEGDDLHTEAAVLKMRDGIPLHDAERLPWLDRVGDVLWHKHDDGASVVLGCSALKRSYRDRLAGIVPETVFIHLDGDRDVIAARLSQREHAYMPPGLLASQIEELESVADEERAIVVDIDQSPNGVVRDIEELLVTMTDTSGGSPDGH